MSKLNQLVAAFVVFMSVFPVLVQSQDNKYMNLQIDLQGDAHYSVYNFTDIKRPYNGIDGWSELKASYWLDTGSSLSPYLSIIPSITSESEFWWQKNFQVSAGMQFYPISISIRYLRSIRLFALTALRSYYKKPEEVNPEDKDIQIGVDYYYDNIFEKKSLIFAAWTNAGFRKTNFSLENYDAFLWTGNLKFGYKYAHKKSILFSHATIEWTDVPKYKNRWWENFLRAGIGVQWYPKAYETNRFVSGLLRRFHLYIEVLHNVTWLGERPNDNSQVEETDFRAGLVFSTSGFFRE